MREYCVKRLLSKMLFGASIFFEKIISWKCNFCVCVIKKLRSSNKETRHILFLTFYYTGDDVSVDFFFQLIDDNLTNFFFFLPEINFHLFVK